MLKLRSKKISKSTHRLKLSACWIVKNEEANLRRSIESVRDQVDELIVVDTGSTDNTIAVAESFDATIFNVPWTDDFSAPRNHAIDHATGDWIIFLDADEYFVTSNKIRRAVEKIAAKSSDLILIPRINIDDKNDRELGRDWCPRIFRRIDYLRYRGIIHETINDLRGRPLAYTYGGNELTIYHTGYAPARIEDKLRRNLELINREIDQIGHQPQHDIALVDCYFGLHDYEKALDHALQAIKSDVQPIAGRSNLYHKAIDAMRALHYPDEEMLELADEAIKTLPQLPEFYAERGMILCGLQRLDEAYLSFHKSLEMWRAMPEDVHEQSYFRAAAPIVYARLAEIELLVGNIDGARKNLSAAIKLDPNNTEYRARFSQLTR